MSFNIQDNRYEDLKELADMSLETLKLACIDDNELLFVLSTMKYLVTKNIQDLYKHSK